MFLSLSNSMSCLRMSNAEDKSNITVWVIQYLVNYISHQIGRVQWFQYYGVYGTRFVRCPATYFQIEVVISQKCIVNIQIFSNIAINEYKYI